MYFTKETEQAIIDYVKSDSRREKNRLFEEHIYYPFYKIVESLINKDFRPNYFQIPIEDVKNRVISHMIQKMSKFDKDKGKAFSYFSVMARNKLIQENRKAYNKRKNNESIDEDETFLDIRDEDDWYHQQETYSDFMTLFVEYWEKNMDNIFKKDRDLQICDAIVKLMKRCKNIEDFNKKRLYLMIREMTGAKTQYITRVLNTMKDYYEKLSLQYENKGRIDMDKKYFLVIDGEVY